MKFSRQRKQSLLNSSTMFATNCSTTSTGMEDISLPLAMKSPSSSLSPISTTVASADETVASVDTDDRLYTQFKIQELLHGSIRFCSNLDFTPAWSRHLAALQQAIPAYIMCNSPIDMLSHTRKSIHGMTIPQLYIKVPGVWTGGHEENLRLVYSECVSTK